MSQTVQLKTEKEVIRMNQFPEFGCAINADCTSQFRAPCNWDSICDHHVVVGCRTPKHWPELGCTYRKCDKCDQRVTCPTKQVTPKPIEDYCEE